MMIGLEVKRALKRGAHKHIFPTVKFSRLSRLVVISCCLFFLVYGGAFALEIPAFQSLLTQGTLSSDELGILVLDEENNPVFTWNESRKLKPASLSKIVTGAAALELLGTSCQFRTQLLYDGRIEGRTLNGSLFLRNGGDPTFTPARLPTFLADLKSKNVTRIEGNLVLDDSRFQEVRTAGWQRHVDSLNPKMFPLFVSLDPPANVSTSSKSWQKMRRNSRRFTEFSGRFVVYQNMAEPNLWTGYEFHRMLRQHGIQLSGKLIRGEVPAKAQLLSEIVSPLTQVVSRMMKSSDNFYADMLVRNLSAEFGEKPATFETGLSFVNLFLDQIQIPRSEYSFNSGSGFSHQNFISARALSSILNHLKNEDTVSSYLLSSLPIAGVDGTLQYRMRKTAAQGRIHAKTGYLRSVRTKTVQHSGAVTLAGFAERPDGKILTFVFLYNGRQSPYLIRSIFDKICVQMIGPPAPVPIALLAPP
jgi:D-alanyl-D-alanine carboxypeptidase/D-alanyl-D-alanine-endopeptidase (penicillin-binding protein 4)